MTHLWLYSVDANKENKFYNHQAEGQIYMDAIHIRIKISQATKHHKSNKETRHRDRHCYIGHQLEVTRQDGILKE